MPLPQFPRPPIRNMTDFVVWVFATMIVVLLFMIEARVIAVSLIKDDPDIENTVKDVHDVLGTLIGALIGFIAGRGSGKAEAAEEHAETVLSMEEEHAEKIMKIEDERAADRKAVIEQLQPVPRRPSPRPIPPPPPPSIEPPKKEDPDEPG